MGTLELELKSALLEFNSEKAKSILLRNIDDKNELIPGLIEKVLANIGSEWETGELALSQVYMSGQICEKIVDDIFKNDDTIKYPNPQIAIVTFNDFHVLGKKIVSSIIRSVGIQLIDFGNGLNIETLVDKIEKGNIKILLISVLMLPSALKIKDLIDTLNKKNISVKILVGGAPFIFDDMLWEQVGADAMAKSATEAIEIINRWLVN
jgi:methanogenic corrinoid protein MtbC1